MGVCCGPPTLKEKPKQICVFLFFFFLGGGGCERPRIFNNLSLIVDAAAKDLIIDGIKKNQKENK